jgi:hypothetical protein
MTQRTSEPPVSPSGSMTLGTGSRRCARHYRAARGDLGSNGCLSPPYGLDTHHHPHRCSSGQLSAPDAAFQTEIP